MATSCLPVVLASFVVLAVPAAVVLAVPAAVVLAVPATAQTPPSTKAADPPPAESVISTPAPMPDPLVSPDLQTSRRMTLAQLVQQSAWQQPVIAAAQEQYRQLPGACATVSFKPTNDLVVYAPIKNGSDGTIASGIWSQRVDATGCGAARQLNVLTVVQPGTPPSRIPTMPGDSHADPQTQKSALQYAQAIAVRASPPGCTRQTFTEARFDGYTGLPDPAVRDRDGRAWREEWSLFACGATYTIEVTFRPNAQGIQLSATNPIKH